jgi:hypothetical protein
MDETTDVEFQDEFQDEQCIAYDLIIYLNL